MSLEVSCLCGAKLIAPMYLVGKTAQCQKCGRAVPVVAPRPGEDPRLADQHFIRFRCNECGKRIKAPPNWAGIGGKCPHCQGDMVIPNLPAQAPAPESADAGKAAASKGGSDMPVAPGDEDGETRGQGVAHRKAKQEQEEREKDFSFDDFDDGIIDADDEGIDPLNPSHAAPSDSPYEAPTTLPQAIRATGDDLIAAHAVFEHPEDEDDDPREASGDLSEHATKKRKTAHGDLSLDQLDEFEEEDDDPNEASAVMDVIVDNPEMFILPGEDEGDTDLSKPKRVPRALETAEQRRERALQRLKRTHPRSFWCYRFRQWNPFLGPRPVDEQRRLLHLSQRRF